MNAPAPASARGPAPNLAQPPRMARRRMLLILTGAFAGVVVLAIALAVILAPADPEAPCPRGKPCGAPPQAEPLVNNTVWRSPELGFALEYSAKQWKVGNESPRGVSFTSNQGDMALTIEGVPATDARPRELFDRRLDQVRERTLGLDDDTEPAHRILAPVVGLHPGVGGAYRAAVDTPQGTTAPLGIAMLAAGNDRVSIVVVGATGETSEGNRDALFSRADSILNTLRMPGDEVPR
ncbi:MAG TPA: hypothetical protein VNB64_01185 [Solirubrobacteraceae bacterium]|nr:hypothetical protein [Solirubrobacteraceae bacterium]